MFVSNDLFHVVFAQEKRSPLAYASGEGHTEVVKILLKAGATVNSLDKVCHFTSFIGHF